MPKAPKASAIGNAVKARRFATGRKRRTYQPTTAKTKRRSYSVSEAAGPAAKSLTKERRTAIARNAARARCDAGSGSRYRIIAARRPD